jgi:thiamine-monophosphate kinase
MSDFNERERVRWLADFFGALDGDETGIGDDAALIKPGGEHLYALTIDTLTEGRHFRREQAGPGQIGHKSAAVSLSDLAAMGARPETMLVSSGFEASLPEEDVKQLFEGIRTACDPFSCSVSGGDLYGRDGGTTITTVALGPCPYQPVRRNGLSDGDLLYVTGPLGGSIRGRHLSFTPRVREGLWLAEHGFATAMMDVSDGIVIDLDRMLEQSNQPGAVLFEDRIPVHPDAEQLARDDDRSALQHALYDGEDFELLLGVDPEHAQELENQYPHSPPLIRVGRVSTDLEGIRLEQPDGSLTELNPDGYQHF